MPHAFNTRKNQHYVGRIPDLGFYYPDGPGRVQKRKKRWRQGMPT